MLDGQKGEAILQRGYAFLNRAILLLHKDDPEAVSAAKEALRLHRAYPYASASDIADAVALDFVVRIFFRQTLSESEFMGAWEEVKAAPCASLIRDVAFNFVSNYLLFVKQLSPAHYATAREEIEQWALPGLAEKVIALAEGGPDRYKAVELTHRLQRGLLGTTDSD